MHKKTKIFISLFFVFSIGMFFQISFSKYVIENTYTIAKLDIDRCKPKIEFTHIIHNNDTHLITGHIKITEKNIVRNDLSPDNIKLITANKYVTPEYKSFSLISENSTEKIYEFSFSTPLTNHSFILLIPKGIVEDKSGLLNEQEYFSANTNTP